MPAALFIALQPGLVIARAVRGRWSAEVAMAGRTPLCLAVCEGDGASVYCGTTSGLWRSRDLGASWIEAGRALTGRRMTAVACAAGGRTVYAGTAPSAVFRSADGGETWDECPALTALPSAASWSFPPKPGTHHVRCLAVDPSDASRLYVCIEAGALVRSPDGGGHWEDRTPDGPRDTHALAVDPRRPLRLCTAAGDGYFESADRGDSWRRAEAGFRHRYVWDIAIDSGDADGLVVSAAASARQAHHGSVAESFIYCRRNGGEWRPAVTGLPSAEGTTISALAADPRAAGVFYACNNHGVFRSANAGVSWAPLDVPWPSEYRVLRVGQLYVAG